MDDYIRMKFTCPIIIKPREPQGFTVESNGMILIQFEQKIDDVKFHLVQMRDNKEEIFFKIETEWMEYPE